MRAIALLSVVMLALSCGSGNSSGNQSGAAGPGQIALHLITSGDGLIRGAGSDCRGACTAQLAKGSQVQLQAVPDSGATFGGWSGACSGAGSCQFTLNAETSVTATFTRTAPGAGSRRLTVVVEGSGRVTSNPAGIDCDSSTCSAEFTDGTTVSLAAINAANFSFSGWGGACSGPGACFLALHADAEVFAHFDRGAQQAHLTIAVTGPGHVGGAGIDCGNGATACDVAISSLGSAVILTAAGGANVRFLGWGGACGGTSATCSVTVQGDTRVAAAFDFELQSLFANDGTTSMNALAINSTDVFFTRFLPDGASTWAVSKSGGAARRVTNATGVEMVADDGFLYFVSGQTVGGQAIFSTPVGGGDTSRIFEVASQPIGRLALDNGALYFAVLQTLDKAGSIHRMQDRVDQMIAAGQPANTGIAVDSAFAYFTFTSLSGSDHGIKRVDKLGQGAVSTLISTGLVPITVRVDSQNVYYRDQNGVVFAAAKDGSGNHVVSGNPGRAFLIDFDVNAFVVFWLWTDSTNGPHGLFRANADSSGFAALDTASDNSWTGPVVDDTAAYYWHTGNLMKRLK